MKLEFPCSSVLYAEFWKLQHIIFQFQKPNGQGKCFFIVPLASPQLHDYTRSRGNSNSSDVLKKSGWDWG
ncbi:hypothetical protein DWY36_04395 [Firmicutes bacterium AF25-13AC]|nr:hypothetical protein DWY36_04395 [Firmicutes bacterium AF25-13AC]